MQRSVQLCALQFLLLLPGVRGEKMEAAVARGFTRSDSRNATLVRSDGTPRVEARDPRDGATGSVMAWLRGALVTGCISWNKLEPEP
ncbi:hypothetical protein EYF80_036685 [Liparis tanakae]|uniref:Uncharacterized protein n=1 Tax=Liparis tanakae TaxID=230148 RepID=A0A4Z2GJP7_9TELE|nr:hypothetical protein EYF80_036685 [Liparis tanakae]